MQIETDVFCDDFGTNPRFRSILTQLRWNSVRRDLLTFSLHQNVRCVYNHVPQTYPLRYVIWAVLFSVAGDNCLQFRFACFRCFVILIHKYYVRSASRKLTRVHCLCMEAWYLGVARIAGVFKGHGGGFCDGPVETF